MDKRCKTNPISPERPGMGAGGRGRETPTGEKMRNEPNFSIADCGFRIGDRGTVAGLASLPRGQFYKQTQFRPTGISQYSTIPIPAMPGGTGARSFKRGFCGGR